MSGKQLTALVIIFLYMVLTVVVGLVSSKMKQKKAAKKQSNEDFLMAGKSLGPIILACTLFAANTGGASTTGIATNVGTQGLSASWYVIAAGIGFVLVSFIAPFFRRAQASTVPQIINMRYGKPAHIVTAFTSIAALFMATGSQIIATSTIINTVTGMDFETTAVVVTAVVIAYTMVGGFASVAAANMMHVGFITIGMTIAMIFMVNSDTVGGFSNLMATAKTMTDAEGQNMDLLSMTKVGLPAILGYVAMYCTTFPTGQEIVQTYCSAKDGKSAKVGSVIAGLLSAAYAIVPALIGLMAFTFIDGFAADKALHKNALAAATMEFAPAIIAGIVLSSVVAATISSASGNMIGTATLFTNDVFRPYMNKGEKNDTKEIWISRAVMVLAGCVGLAVALSGSNIISIMMSAFALRSAGPFAAFICGLFYKKVTKNAGFLSIVFGTAVAAIWIYALKTPFGLNAAIPASLVAFIVIFLVSAVEGKKGVAPAPELVLEDN
ncbi:MAG: sodium:solute symporter family protein [Oscillospiraceae bacterium]|nr:sodium:solute symporter family protein [Oscillospiraceae bacterium]